MAAWTDLLTRLELTINADRRLHCESIYRAAPLPGWLAMPWADAQRNAGNQTPVLTINVKGAKVDETLCLLRLADLEILSEAARALERLAGPERAELVADPATRAAALADLEQAHEQTDRRIERLRR